MRISSSSCGSRRPRCTATPSNVSRCCSIAILDCLLEENRKEDLQLMYNLLGRVKNGQQELCNKMAEYVKKRGKVIVINPEKDKTMVQELLDFKEKLDTILRCCFSNNDKFITSLKVRIS